jgi:hypothetical protein
MQHQLIGTENIDSGDTLPYQLISEVSEFVGHTASFAAGDHRVNRPKCGSMGTIAAASSCCRATTGRPGLIAGGCVVWCLHQPPAEWMTRMLALWRAHRQKT